MKTDKFEEINYDSVSHKEKIDFSNKIAEQYGVPKKSTRVKLFSGWLGWALSYGVGIAFGHMCSMSYFCNHHRKFRGLTRL